MKTAHINTTQIVGLLAALLLTAAEVLIIDHDAQQRVAQYQAEAAKALAARG